jgi:hypothetical protein
MNSAGKFISTTGLFIALGIHFGSVSMIASAAESDRTPLGGELAGNKDGSIPAWSAETPSTGWTYGKSRFEAWKHKHEKPLFSIDQSNVDKYADKLSPAQVALIKSKKDYRMDVYPTHRSCASPDFVIENTKKNIEVAELNADGWGLKNAILPGIPFPSPKSGAEAMWNFKMRYRGMGIEMHNVPTMVSPRSDSSEYIEARSYQTFYIPWGAVGSKPRNSQSDVEFYTYYGYSSPTALAGQGIILTINMSQPSDIFYYFTGQRRVRRMPTYSYDSPQIGFENQYTMDQPLMFLGLMDRFNWKLVGKKEMYVPYNNLNMFVPDAKLHDIAQPSFINNDHRRYELHRVWVVEASVKPGMRHISPKRTFYIDEDSWNMVVADDYDAQGKVWKLREGFSIPVYETNSCDVLPFVQYDLGNGRYVFDQSAVGTGKDIKWLTESKDPKFTPSFYTSENLRAISER